MQLLIQGVTFFLIFALITYVAQVKDLFGVATSTGVSSRRGAARYGLLTGVLATALYLLFQLFLRG